MKCLPPFDLGGIVTQYMDIEYDRQIERIYDKLDQLDLKRSG